MKKIIKFEWYRMIHSKSFLISMLTAMIIVAVDAHSKYELFKDGYDVYTSVFEKWIGTFRGFDEAIYYFMLLPLITSFAYSWTISYDRSSGYITQILTRANRKKYFLAKYLVTFISGGIIFSVSLLFHFMLISMFFPAYYSDVALGSSPVSPFSAFAELFYTSPYIFILVWTLTAFLWGGAMVCIASAAGMLVRKYSIAVVTPFLIFTVQQILANYITLRYSILIHNHTVCILWSDMLSAASGIATFANLIYLNIVSIIVTTTLIYVIRGRKYECL